MAAILRDLALTWAGYQLIALDNFTTGHRNLVRWGPLVEAVIREAGAVMRSGLVTAAQTEPFRKELAVAVGPAAGFLRP